MMYTTSYSIATVPEIRETVFQHFPEKQQTQLAKLLRWMALKLIINTKRKTVSTFKSLIFLNKAADTKALLLQDMTLTLEAYIAKLLVLQTISAIQSGAHY